MWLRRAGSRLKNQQEELEKHTRDWPRGVGAFGEKAETREVC